MTERNALTDKAILEEKMQELAKKQTEKEYCEFIELMTNNKFASRIQIKLDDEEIHLFDCGYEGGLLPRNVKKITSSKYRDKGILFISSISSMYTNLEKVYNDVLEENAKKSSDELLRKVKNLSGLLGD